MGRGRKWETLQDEALVRAYLDLSQNAIQGAEQKAASFWDSILNRFNNATKPKKEEVRTAQALRNRWSSISHDVAKFVGCYSVIKARNESGKSADDVMKDTRLLFREQQGSEFSFESCWLILQKCPKFMDGIRTRGSGSNAGVAGEVEKERPTGRKKAKTDLAAEIEDSKKLKQLVDDNKERNSVIFAQMKRKNDLIEEQLTMDLFKTDPNSEESKTFFSFMRKKRLASIMDREAARELETSIGGRDRGVQDKCQNSPEPDADVAIRVNGTVGNDAGSIEE
ncbi:Long chain acyl-CoA synthetase 7 [Phytophthora nicotianae]|uniref:Long chain acyl-CoA synthetase 7 n=1 Tax=Phytophthora nicotianae TaxID=4792 RepID=A0A0W8DF84_PHYNI|nr:Long chain acyl-CoA synthetase 7 [Phytophthora nicotianae]